VLVQRHVGERGQDDRTGLGGEAVPGLGTDRPTENVRDRGAEPPAYFLSGRISRDTGNSAEER